MVRVSVALLLSLCISGCAGLPEAEKASQLGTAISASGKLLRDAVAANRTNAIRIGEEKQANILLLAKDVSQSAPPNSEAYKQAVLLKQNFTLADAPAAYLEGFQDSAQIRAVEALEAYGDALKSAVDQGAIDKLEQASVKLGDAVGTLVSMASPIAVPAIKVGARLGGFLAGNIYANEIQAIIVARNEDVKGIAGLLKKDMARIARVLNNQTRDFEIRRKGTLMLVSDDPGVDRLRLYNEYFVARKDAATMKALATTASKYGKIIGAMVDAHEAVATGNPDASLFLKRFLVIADDLTALVKTARQESGT
jgi:hypothetical protein